MAQTAEELFESGGRELTPEELFEQAGTPVGEPPGAFEAVARGLAEGATLGLGGRIAGIGAALEELGERAGAAFVGSGREDVPLQEAFTRGRAESERERIRAQAEFPKLTTAAEFVGGVAAPLPGLGQAATAARAVPVAGRVLAPAVRYGVPGAVAGAVSAYGRGEAEDVPAGAVAGFVGGTVAGPLVAKAAEASVPKAQAVGRWLREKAAERALKTVMIQKDIQKMPTAKRLEVGGRALEEGFIKPFRTAAGLEEGIQAAEEKIKGELSEAYRAADQALAKTQGLSEGTLREVRGTIAERAAADAKAVRASAAAQEAAELQNAAAIREQVAELEAAKETLKAKLRNTLDAFEGKRTARLADVEAEAMAAGGVSTKQAAEFPFQPVAFPELAALRGRSAAQQDKALDELAGRMLSEADSRVERGTRASIYGGRLTPRPLAEYAEPVRAAFAQGGKARESAIATAVSGGVVQAPEPKDIQELRRGVGIDLSEVARRIRSEVIPRYEAPGNKAEVKLLSDLADEYEAEAARGVNIQEANRFKTEIGKKVTRWFVPEGATERRINEARKDVYDTVNQFVEESVEAQLPPERVKQYLDAKQRYYAVMRFLEATPSAMAREAGNRAISLSDYLAAQMGAISTVGQGSKLPFVTLAAALAHQQARQRGASAGAYYGNRVSQYLQNKYGADAAAAAARGGAGAAAEYFRLSQQDPMFRKLDEEDRKAEQRDATAAP